MPITLFIQYTRVIIVFYSFNGVLQSIPAISTNNPLASIIPTAFIIFLGIMKELYYEYKRYKEDNLINSQQCEVLEDIGDGGKLVFKPQEIQKVRVGDILRLTDDTFVPADCVLLQAEHDNGECFI